jgi:surface polysaccharide O-acyltransferase-like enzyme
MKSKFLKIEKNISLDNNSQAIYQKYNSIGNNIRLYYYDCLRIISSFAVIIIHVSASSYNQSIINSTNWKISLYYNGASRFAVPIFFMISGDLFLKKDIYLKNLFLKYIKNLLFHYIFWSLIYSSIKIKYSIIIRNLIYFGFKGYYHLWYLLTTIGLYMMVPFLREIVKKDILLKTFLLISFFINFILPIILNFLYIYNKDYYQLLKYIYLRKYLNYLKGPIFYFMLGYYLNNIKRINNYIKLLIYFFGLIGFCFTTKLSYEISIKQKKKNKFFSLFKFKYSSLFY